MTARLWPFALFLALAPTAQAAPDMSHSARAEAYARTFFTGWADDTILRSAITDSLVRNRHLDYDGVLAQDRLWRDERAPDYPGPRLAVDAVMNNPLSTLLHEKMASAPGGAVTAIQVLDGWGWNVAQTAPTSDFYQGDEHAWQNAITSEGEAYVSAVEEDVNGRIVQVSLPIRDGETGIGVVAINLDIDKLP